MHTHKRSNSFQSNVDGAFTRQMDDQAGRSTQNDNTKTLQYLISGMAFSRQTRLKHLDGLPRYYYTTGYAEVPSRLCRSDAFPFH